MVCWFFTHDSLIHNNTDEYISIGIVERQIMLIENSEGKANSAFTYPLIQHPFARVNSVHLAVFACFLNNVTAIKFEITCLLKQQIEYGLPFRAGEEDQVPVEHLDLHLIQARIQGVLPGVVLGLLPNEWQSYELIQVVTMSINMHINAQYCH